MRLDCPKSFNSEGVVRCCKQENCAHWIKDEDTEFTGGCCVDVIIAKSLAMFANATKAYVKLKIDKSRYEWSLPDDLMKWSGYR